MTVSLASGPEVCPVCSANSESKKQVEKLRAELHAGYGVLPPEEWSRRSRELETMEYNEKYTPDRTMRFKNHCGISGDGVFVIRYHVECSLCGLTFEFNHSESVVKQS